MMCFKVGIRCSAVFSRCAVAMVGLIGVANAQAPVNVWSGLKFGLADPLWKEMEGRAEVADRLGVNLIRKMMFWSGMETLPGVYDFSRSDRIVAEAEAAGRSILFILSYGNPIYTGAVLSPPRTPAAIEAFARFAKACADRYKGHEVSWEVWNEPNGGIYWDGNDSAREYATLLRATVPAIREADPNAKIYAPSMGGFDLNWLTTFLEQPLPSGISYFAIHPYTEKSPEDRHVPSWLRMVQDGLYLSEVRDLPPIAITEWSYLAPKAVTFANQANWQTRIPLVSPFYVDSLSVFYGIQGPESSWDPSEASAGLIDPAGNPRETYNKMLFLAPHVSGAQLVGRIKSATDNVWTLLMRSKSGKPTLVSWTQDVSEATPITPAAATYQVGRSEGDFQTVPGSALQSLVSDGAPMVISSTSDDALWGPMSTIGRLPNTFQVGYSKTRMEVVSGIHGALRDSQLPGTAQVEIRSGTEALVTTASALRGMTLTDFVSKLALRSVVVGNLAETEKPLSVAVKIGAYPWVRFDLGENRWPAPVRTQVRTLGSTATIAGTKPARLDMPAYFKIQFGASERRYPYKLQAGAKSFNFSIGTTAGRRQAHLLTVQEGTMAGSFYRTSDQDLRILSFDQAVAPYIENMKVQNIDTKGTCNVQVTDEMPCPAGNVNSLKITGVKLLDGVLRVNQGPNLKLPAGSKRIDMWVYPKGPVAYVDFNVKDPLWKPFWGKVTKVRPNEWNLLQMTVPSTGSDILLRDLIRVFPAAGANVTDMVVYLGEMRVYGTP